ncbi:MAG: radical SAM protein [Halanaerobiales bacterium]|nr:radical SAM protein [Halanaerobiales bacterium]
MSIISNLLEIPLDDEYILLINTLNGAVDLINQPGYQVIQDWKSLDHPILTEETKDLYNFLKERGYLATPEEEARIKEEWMVQFRHSLIEAQKKLTPMFVITYDCNFRCKYCYEKTLLKKGSSWMNKVMTKEQVDKIYNYLDDMCAKEGKVVEEISLYGGEPLLLENEEIVHYILKEGHQRGVSFNITTNGYTLDHYSEILKDYQIKGIQVTVDGPLEVHDKYRYTKRGEGSYTKIMKGIEAASEYRLPIRIRSNVSIESLSNIDLLIEDLNSRGLTHEKNIFFYLAPIAEGIDSKESNCMSDIFREICYKYEDLGFSKSVMDQILNRFSQIAKVFETGKMWAPKFINCEASVGKLIFDPYDMIYPCGILIGEEQYAIGRYLPEIEFNSTYNTWINRTIENIEKCRDCSAAVLCGGGCPVDPLKKTGDLMQPNCSYMDILIKTFIPFFYNKFLKPKLLK